ncbi:carbohydrate ABC transporter permease [Paenibacillus montanisoli]|uniref:Carbohydrate ABC transporter permease n=1 Tax=Paenibacillus montanisoli TaxID=2081970 RepID=A0A328U4L3_9BACL|nr:carbohydrate ABC transporter permease [Paenibacillus montanisoli]RAP77758.1 carbohydrate ABC transporter permease [Paenibacillus montanisoli]
MNGEAKMAGVLTTRGIRIHTRRRTMRGYVLDGFLLLLSFLMLAPFLWMISTSLRLPQDSFSLPPAIFPTAFNVENYGQVFKQVPFTNFILNSLEISLIIVVGHIFISSMAAFAFARITFPGRNLIFIIFLAGLMIPGQVTIIPQFILISKLGLVDTHWALILPALINPLGIFMIRQMMMTISSTYDEAAYMDGASRMWVFLRVILPMVFPAVAVTSVMTFIGNWNDFFRPLIFLNTFEKMTLPLGMTVLNGTFGSGNLSAILAGVTLSLIVPLLFYMFGQKYLVEGITAGGLKI